MKRLLSLFILSSLFFIASAFMAIDKKVADDDNGFCEDVKKITAIFDNKEFDKLKGKQIKDESAPKDKQYVSAITLKGYISQIVYDTEKEIYFAADLNEDFKNGDALKEKLKLVAKKLEKCLDVEMEYNETKNFLIYMAVLDSGIEVELSGNYPSEKRRYINLDISYKKD